MTTPPDAGFTHLDTVELADPATAFVYEHGWQSWSPTGCHPATGTSPRPAHGWQQVMRYRPETPPPPVGHQGEGLLILSPGHGQPLRIYTASRPDIEIPSIRAEHANGIITVTANGPADTATSDADLNTALAVLGDTLGSRLAARVRPAPTVWCSWYHYFLNVTEDDILENLRALDEHHLPVDVVQIDDGWQADIGDWTTLSPRFSSTRDLAQRIHDHGRRAGIWLAPFIAGANSTLAREHPDWLLGDAGRNWNQQLHGIDLTHPGVREYLAAVFNGLHEQGYDYFKLDFLYGGALRGHRHADATAVQAYREGLQLIREAVGPDSYLVGCGAPILPSIGIVDAMRVSADTYNPDDPDNGTDVLRGQPAIEARAWQQGRFWINDPDCLVARPQFSQRTQWAHVIENYGGLRSVSDRIAELDKWGLDSTRRLLRDAPPARPFKTLPQLTPSPAVIAPNGDQA